MRARSLLITAATVAMVGALSAPAVVSAADAPGFKMVLTSQQTAVPAGAPSVSFVLWNEATSGEPVPMTVTTDASWATPAPASFLLASGTNQPVIITLAAGASGKALVTFRAAAGTVGAIRVVRALASPIYVGVLPPRPPLQAIVAPAHGFDWLRPDWRLIGLVLAIMAIVRLAALIRRRRLVR